MEQEFTRIASGMYEREYRKANGETSRFLYGRLKCKKTGERPLFALGSDLSEAKDRWSEIKIANRRGEDLSRFKPEKKAEPESAPMIFSEWAKEYPLQEGVKEKRSLCADLGMIRLHLEPFFGGKPVAAITRALVN